MSAPAAPATGGTTRLQAALRSELHRWRRSAAGRLPLLGVAFGGLVSALFLASGFHRTWPRVLAFENLWAVFLGPLGAALLVATVCHADRRDRGGGTLWRPLRPVTARTSRFAVLAALVLVMNALAVATPFTVASALLEGPPPWLRALELVAVLGLSQLGLAALVLRVAGRVGRLPAMAVGAAWTMTGLLTAESPAWVVVPPTWLVRGALPLIGTHANGVALEPGAALASASPWPAALLGALLALPVLLVPSLRPLRGPRGRRVEARAAAPTSSAARVAWTPRAARPADRAGTWSDAVPGRPRVLAAVLRATRWTAVGWVPVAAVLLVALVVPWQGVEAAAELYALLVLPAAAAVLPLVVWGAVAQGWVAVASRPTGTSRPARAVVVSTVAVGLLTDLAVGAVLAAGGLPGSVVVVLLLSCAVTGTLLVCGSLWLVVRFGAAAALGTGIGGVLLAALVGGTGLQQRLWLVTPWAWGACTAREQLVVTVPAAVVLALLGSSLAVRAARSAVLAR